jgi:hypothetical protein
MGTDQTNGAAGPPGRPTGVPKLNLNEIKGASSQNKPIFKKDSKTSSTSTTYNKMATPRSQTFSPPHTHGSLSGTNKSSKTAAAGSNDRLKTPPTSSGVSFATLIPQRTGSGGDGRLSSSASQTNNTRIDCDQQQPMMTPRGGSYRDMLLTPRGTIRSLGEQYISNNALPPKQRHPAPPSSSSRSTSATIAPSNSSTHQQQQEKILKQKVDRASHEQTHVKQQISTLDAAIQAQQAALIENIAIVQNLGQRRDRMANDAAALQAAVARANAAASATQADIQELEVLITGLQATLQASQRREEEQQEKSEERDTPGGDQRPACAAAHKKQALIHLMQAAAGALRLPSVTLALETELQKQQLNESNQANQATRHQQEVLVTAGRGQGGTATSRAVTARSDMSTSRFVTPAGTGRENGEDNDSVISSSSSEENSMDSSRTGIAEDDVPRAVAAKGAATTSNAVGGKLHRPRMNVPLLQLPADTIPAYITDINKNTATTRNTHQSSARLPSPTPQALARLQSIRSKLEVAEAILTARVPEDGEETIMTTRLQIS